MMRKFLTLGLLVILPVVFYAQNTVVTDDESYEAHSSAMLDVYSLSKGLLVPRLTTTQRNAISTPADGLLVYDTNEDKYYYYGGSIWNPIDAPSLWSENSDTIFITGVGKRYGVGTASPLAKLTVQGDATIAADEPLFEVKNSTGDVIFAVYENEVQVNFKEGTKGVKGGFAVGGLSGSKADPVEYMRITPDSVRIYINDPIAKGVKGGFAVGGLSGTKASKRDYFTIERDSARIYVDDQAKGVKGGFAVGGLSGTKSDPVNFLNLTTENYFIGHRAGLNTNPGTNSGKYNSFLGYEAGMQNTWGYNNVFIGFNAGHSNTHGANHVFIGNNAGYNYLGTEDGEENVFIGNDVGYNDSISNNSIYIGTRAGYNIKNGSSNVVIGDRAGSSGNAQSSNVFLGSSSGRDNNGSRNTMLGSYAGFTTDGENNVMIGYQAGGHASGSNNVFIGNEAGDYANVSNQLIIGNSETSQLIWGDFSAEQVALNGNVGINATPSPSYQLYVIEDTETSDRPAIYAVHNVTDNYGVGVRGLARYRAIWGQATTASGTGYGVYGYASGVGTGTRYGVYGYASGGTTAWAGYFSGNVRVTGTFDNAKSLTKIDHPEDPANKFLVHAQMSSAEMKNYYDGMVVLDENGKANVQLPDYFEAVNKDFRYQLTAIGRPAPSIYIEKEIQNNSFVIAGGEPGMKISWVVTGVRNDPYAVQHKLENVELKTEDQKGKYLHPELYGKSKKQQIGYDSKESK